MTNHYTPPSVSWTDLQIFGIKKEPSKKLNLFLSGSTEQRQSKGDFKLRNKRAFDQTSWSATGQEGHPQLRLQRHQGPSANSLHQLEDSSFIICW